MSTMQNIINQKTIELNLLSKAYYLCGNCGFVKAEDCYIAISHFLCCNKCGEEIN